jgi:hypothetical protein
VFWLKKVRGEVNLVSSKITPRSFNIITVLVFLLSGCGTDTIKADEKADPVLVEYPVVFIERTLNTSIEEDVIEQVTFSARNPLSFNPGAQLIVKSNAFPDSPRTNISAPLFSVDLDADELLTQNNRIDIRDLSVSDDGQQLLVSIRAPEIEDADDDEQPTWNIWHYQLSTKQLVRLVVNDFVAEQGDDVMASFLPDGRIIFASTRQRISRAILLDEGKPQYTATNERGDNAALNLHVMNADGTNIKQITFNLSHDFYPLVLQDGRILYSRWDAMGGNDKVNLYIMNPDGTDNQLIYGWHSHQLTVDDGTENIDFIKPQQLPNGDILLLLASNDGLLYQKKPITININDFIDNEQLVYGSSVQNNAQADAFSSEIYDFNFSSQVSTSGFLSYLYPLPDDSERFLLSWDSCRVVIDEVVKACGQLTEEELAQEDIIAASPWYELWLYNAKDNTQQLVSKTTEGQMITEAVVMQESSQPSEYIADKSFTTGLDVELADQQTAAIHIRSVYDIDGEDVSEGITRLSDPSLTPAIDLPARFLRVVRGVPMPPNEVRNVVNTDFGRSNNQLMREILGYTPIQPDGSVNVKVPANIPIALSVLDVNGQRIGGRHRQWITLKAGETLECHGCHEQNSKMPHGRIVAQAPSINVGASGGVPFTHANESIIPEQGQTMAEANTMANGLAQLSADIVYNDLWTEPTISTVNNSINYTYNLLESPKPTGSDCFDNWSAYCRIQINYTEHIHPLWELSREAFNADTAELISDNTCVNCHGLSDNNNLAQIPAGQLDLSGTDSSDQPAHLTSYRELFFNDVEQEIIEGILIDKRIEQLDENGDIVYQVDIEGELILDVEGNPIPVLTTIPVPAIFSTNGAQSSSRFFELFSSGSHKGRLSVHELKLISEWLDIGGQYYNTPFYQED